LDRIKPTNSNGSTNLIPASEILKRHFRFFPASLPGDKNPEQPMFLFVSASQDLWGFYRAVQIIEDARTGQQLFSPVCFALSGGTVAKVA